MKKITLLHAALLVISTLFISCADLSFFEKETEEFTWDGEISLILGDASYSLSELFEELEVENLGDKDGIISFTHTESFNTNDNASGDLIEIDIPNIESVTTVYTPVSITDKFPSGVESYEVGTNGGANDPLIGIYPTDQVSEPMLITIEQDLTSASFDSGTLTLAIDNKFGSEITITIEIPSITKKIGGEIYSEEKTILANSIDSFDVNLNLFNADFTNDGTGTGKTVNTFVTTIESEINIKQFDIINKTSTLELTATLADLSSDEVYGDFKEESFTTTNDEINFDFFSDFGEGDITFADASMTLEITNGFGFPVGIDVSGIQASNGVDAPVALTYDGTQESVATDPADKIVVNGISTPSTLPVAATPRVLNSENSNINTLFSMKPTSFIMDISGGINPESTGVNENFFAATNNGLQVNITVDVPLHVEFEDVTITQDKIQFELGEDLDGLTNIELRTSTINNISSYRKHFNYFLRKQQ